MTVSEIMILMVAMAYRMIARLLENSTFKLDDSCIVGAS